MSILPLTCNQTTTWPSPSNRPTERRVINCLFTLNQCIHGHFNVLPFFLSGGCIQPLPLKVIGNYKKKIDEWIKRLSSNLGWIDPSHKSRANQPCLKGTLCNENKNLEWLQSSEHKKIERRPPEIRDESFLVKNSNNYRFLWWNVFDGLRRVHGTNYCIASRLSHIYCPVDSKKDSLSNESK